MSTARDEIVRLLKGGGKFRIKGENDEGMNAYAFVAEHVPLKRPVFLKIYDASPERVDIFAEPRFLVDATGNDPSGSSNLVQILDAEHISEYWVLVAMELVEGGSLLNAIQPEGLPLMDALEIVKGILRGVARMHSLDLVHRDIKPANILLGNASGRLHPKLGDFGSVARLSSPTGEVTASRHSALYVPPEGWQNPSRYGKQSDIYQVGLVLHEMLNGSLPYDEESYLDTKAKSELRRMGGKSLGELDPFDRCSLVDAALARRAEKRKILSLRPTREYVLANLKRIIAKATHPDPSQRHGSAVDMLSDLNALCFPNWQRNGDVFTASGWANRDWQIVPIRKRNGTEIHVKSAFNGGAMRRGHTASNLPNAFRWVQSRTK